MKPAKVIRKLVARARRCAASTVTEYAVIAAIISIAGIVLLGSIGRRTTVLLDKMNTNFPK